MGCGWDYTPSDNILPDPNADEAMDESQPPDLGGDGGVELPATYRMDCVDIQSLGDADEEVFQVATLQNTWAADIANFKLNILVDLLAEDADAGTGTVSIRSGVGAGWSDQCSEANTESAEFPVTYSPGVETWIPDEAAGQCAQMGGAGVASGTYELEMGKDDFVFIYAEDNDGTAFNCSLEAGAPSAIPIAGISATLSMAEDRNMVAGTLTGCMSEAGAQNICSCLAICQGNQHPNCPGCPGGAVPLGALLGGIGPTSHCSDLLGEPAFDVVLQFTAQRLGATPMTCG